jgi:PAS domain S-box-containing protein
MSPGNAIAGGLSPQVLEQLFDHAPDVAFFIKDTAGRYVAVNDSLVQRCGLQHKSQLAGRLVSDVFPKEWGRVFAAQDAAVLRSGRPVLDRLELHWYARRKPGWCLTTKLPLRDATGRLSGIIGISRDLRAHDDARDLPPGITAALAYLEKHLGDPLSPVTLARAAGLPAPRFARHIKRIFRVTPSQLITNARLSASSRLLKETRQSVAEVALACGFYDHSAFSRAFRLATGMTPTVFREGGE